MAVTVARPGGDDSLEKVGGFAALYLALALIVAIPYFLLVVDYPSAESAADKVDLVVDNYASLYAMYIATYVVFGLAVGTLALALSDRLRSRGSSTVRIATAVGLTWSFSLVASGLIFTYGMTTIHDLPATDQSVQAWQAIEPVALALGGAGGELLGGLWVGLISATSLRSGTFPKGMSWLGIGVGLIGCISIVPPLNDATVGFGLLEIIWLGWLGTILLRTNETSGSNRLLTGAGAPIGSGERTRL